MGWRTKLGALAFASVVALPTAAAAKNGEVTANVHMRAGPGTQYPVIVTIPDGRDVNIHGCLSGYGWCDLSWAGYRGWVYGNYVASFYQDRYVRVPRYGASLALPIISFDFGTYAHRHYRHQPWYRDRWDNGYWRHGRWMHRDRDGRRDMDNRRHRKFDSERTRRQVAGPPRFERDDRDRRLDVRERRENRRLDMDRGRRDGDARGNRAKPKRDACPPRREGCPGSLRQQRVRQQDQGRRRGQRESRR
jgi:uncharacterized protein YraI